MHCVILSNFVWQIKSVTDRSFRIKWISREKKPKLIKEVTITADSVRKRKYASLNMQKTHR